MTPSEAKERQWVRETLRWSLFSLAEIVRFARERHGYMNMSAYFGVAYPAGTDNLPGPDGIPPGYVEVSNGYGCPDMSTSVMLETRYIELLREYLLEKNHVELAAQLGNPFFPATPPGVGAGKFSRL